jgi:hypothetical protein
MSWLFSQALVEEFSRDTSCDGGPSAQLSVVRSAQLFWHGGKPMELSRLSRFGLTSRVLTEAHGEALLTWFREAFLAKTSPLPAQVSESTGRAADCGPTSYESFARYDPVSRVWRTRQCSLLRDFTEFSETWPSWGSMHAGECWERLMSERPIFVRGSGLLPALTTIDAGSRLNRSLGSGAALRSTFGAMTRFDLWPTPTVRGKSGDGLTTVELKFPTPTVSMSRGSSTGALTRKNGRSREGDRLDYALEGSGRNGRLNPNWVEWLMGWPIGWTDLKPLETARFRQWQQQHGNFWQRE